MNKWQLDIIDRLRYGLYHKQSVTLGADEVHIPMNALIENDEYRLIGTPAELRELKAENERLQLKLGDAGTVCHGCPRYKENEQLKAELARYKALERDGRLVVLPCKVGDTMMLEGDGGMFGSLGEMPYKVESVVFEVFGDWGGLTNHRIATIEEIREAAEAKDNP